MMTYNFNFMEDVLGIIVVLVGFIYCTRNWHIADCVRKEMLPCEKELAKNRIDNVYEQFKTLATCSLTMLFFTAVMVQWLHAKVNTAPNVIDIQVFMLKVMVTIVISRMSMCAKMAVERLSTIRDEDIICRDGCKYCPKVAEMEKEANAI